MAKLKQHTAFLNRFLLICGMLFSVLRAAADIFSAMWYPGYSFINESMSHLAAVGAPTRSFQVMLLIVVSTLIALFGVGVWREAGRRRSMYLTGLFLFIFGIIGVVQQIIPSWSMHLEGGLATQATHIAVTIAAIILIVLFVGFGAYTLGKRFRLFSVISILMLISFGMLAGSKASQAVEYSAPLMGIEERLSYYSYLLWIFVYSFILLQGKNKHIQQ